MELMLLRDGAYFVSISRKRWMRAAFASLTRCSTAFCISSTRSVSFVVARSASASGVCRISAILSGVSHASSGVTRRTSSEARSCSATAFKTSCPT